MCYFVYAASPLTLSEVRSMLPAGLTADLLPAADQQVLRALHPDARTGVRLLAGACSCDLVLARRADREEERHLRSRYFAAGLSRPDVIAALEIHRRGAGRRGESPALWQSALAGFVAEHARNAGPTLYLLRFGHDPLHRRPVPGPPVRLPLSDVVARPDAWLAEDRPMIVAR